MIEDILMFMGLSSVIVLFGFFVIVIIDGVKLSVETLKQKYKIKHRFDKPPTAKCYCIDCRLHDNNTGRCHRFERFHSADNWFCFDAEPKEVQHVQKD